MNEKKDIGKRLENWSAWCRTSSARWAGADSMTGAVCERMRRASLGDVWSGHQVNEARELDDRDAMRIERGMRELQVLDRMILYWTYIEMARPEIVCRKVSLPARPAEIFVRHFLAAQQAIELVVDIMAQKG